MSVREVPFSEIQNRGRATLAEWQREGGRPLRVTRRDDEDLVLMTAVRADQEREVLTAATSMVQTLLGSQDRTLVRQVLLAGFPWVELLSDEETAEFIDELISSLRQGTSLGNPAPPAHTIEMWRHTAEVYADPNLARALSSPSEEDSGTVPIPKR